MCVYDVTNRQSFEMIDNWIYEIQRHTQDKAGIVLVGNKYDLEGEREVTTDEGI